MRSTANARKHGAQSSCRRGRVRLGVMLRGTAGCGSGRLHACVIMIQLEREPSQPSDNTTQHNTIARTRRTNVSGSADDGATGPSRVCLPQPVPCCWLWKDGEDGRQKVGRRWIVLLVQQQHRLVVLSTRGLGAAQVVEHYLVCEREAGVDGQVHVDNILIWLIS